MCDAQKGVCRCMDTDCPVLIFAQITDEQKKAAEALIENKSCTDLCDGFVMIGAISANTRDHILATHNLKKDAKSSYIPYKLQKLATNAKQITDTVIVDFIAATKDFISENGD